MDAVTNPVYIKDYKGFTKFYDFAAKKRNHANFLNEASNSDCDAELLENSTQHIFGIKVISI